jgi:DNA end-binding protein Ku
MARYGTLRTWAQQLGRDDAAKLFEATLLEERATDQALTKLAEAGGDSEGGMIDRGAAHLPRSLIAEKAFDWRTRRSLDKSIIRAGGARPIIQEIEMPSRPFWKGYLKLSLVTCAVAMTPVISERQKVRFHTINRATGHRIQSRYVDAVTGNEVGDDDQVKGYPRGEDDYVMLEDDELEAVALESTRTIDVEAFVPRESIEWIWYDVPHFLTPNDKVGEEAFAVIREATAETDTVGISRLVLYRRERSVMLEPRDKGIVLWTLRYGDEVRDESEYFKGLDEKPDAKMLKMVTGLIGDRIKPWSPKMVEDPVQDRLLDIIKAKQKGGVKKRPVIPPAERGDNVIDIMDALKRSLGQRPQSKNKG